MIVVNPLALQIGWVWLLDCALWWPMGLFPSYFLHQPNYYLKKKKKKNQLALTRSSWNKQKWIMYYFRCMFNRLTIHLRFHLIMIYKYWYVNLYSILKICSKHVIDIYIYIYILLLKANLSIAYHESNFLCWVEISDLGRHLWSCHCGCKLSSVF